MRIKNLSIFILLALTTSQTMTTAKTVAHKIRTVQNSTITVHGWENSLTAKDTNLKNFYWIPIEASKQSYNDRTIAESDPDKVAREQARYKNEAAKRAAVKRAQNAAAEDVKAEISYRKSDGYSGAYDSTAISSASVHACILKK